MVDVVEQRDTAFINTRLRTTVRHRTSVRLQKYATNPYYVRSIVSIMPGQMWRDTGHKARPYARCHQFGRLRMHGAPARGRSILGTVSLHAVHH